MAGEWSQHWQNKLGRALALKTPKYFTYTNSSKQFGNLDTDHEMSLSMCGKRQRVEIGNGKISDITVISKHMEEGWWTLKLQV